MSSSILEVMRVNHEQSELYEVAIGEELDERPNGVSPLEATFFLNMVDISML